MTNLYRKTAIDVLEQGLSAMSKANELLIKQNKDLADQIVDLKAEMEWCDKEIKQLKHKLLVNLETPE